MDDTVGSYTRFFFHAQNTAYRYYRVALQRTWRTTWEANHFEIQLEELASTVSTTVTGMNSTAAYNPRTKEYWIHYYDRGISEWKTYVYHQVLDAFWQFECGGFHNGVDSNDNASGGSFGNKNKDFYLALTNMPDAAAKNAGLWRLGDDDTADPHATMGLQARTGDLDMNAVYKIRNIRIDGKGLTTFKIYYEYDLHGKNATGTHTQTLTGMNLYEWAPKKGITYHRLSWEVLGSVATDAGSQESYFDGVYLEVYKVRDFTKKRGKIG